MVRTLSLISVYMDRSRNWGLVLNQPCCRERSLQKKMNQKTCQMEKPFDGAGLMSGHFEGGFLSRPPWIVPKTNHIFIGPLVIRGSGLSEVSYLSSGFFFFNLTYIRIVWRALNQTLHSQFLTQQIWMGPRNLQIPWGCWCARLGPDFENHVLAV